MKDEIKKTIQKMPGVRGLVQKIETLEREIKECRTQNLFLARENIDLRLKIKKLNGEKIHVVFVCHRPAVWESLHSVYDALTADDHFQVTIVAIPNKKELPGLLLDHEQYASEGAETFWAANGCLKGYDYETGEWLDLRSLKPDYVFFQQPYNTTRPAGYQSGVVSQYAKILYIPYGMWLIGGEVFESTHPADFLNDVSYDFCPHPLAAQDLRSWLQQNDNKGYTKTVVTGFPRFDQFRKPVKEEASAWACKGKEKKFRVLWTPRWCTNEGNCTFFDYKDRVLAYAKNHPEVEIVFRPHPQAFSEWNATGEMPKEEQAHFREACREAGITIDESGEYIHTVRTADCFLTDPSSLLSEYFLTGKPVLYTYRLDCLTTYGNALSEGFFFCHDWSEVESELEKLVHGEDRLKEKRQAMIKDPELYSQPEEGSGEFIKKLILKDAYGVE